MLYRITTSLIMVLMIGLLILPAGCSTGDALPDSQRLSGLSRTSMRSANTYFVRELYDNALENYLGVIEDNPYNIEALTKAGDIYFYYAENQPARAREFYKKSYSMFDRAINAYNDIAHLGDFEAFKEMAENAKLKRTASWGRLFIAGQNLYAEERVEEALNSFYELAEMTPDSTKTYIMIATIHQRQGDFEKAKEYFYQISELDETDTASRTNIAVYYTQEQDYEKAHKWYDDLIKIEPDNPVHYFNKAEVYNLMEEYERSIAYFEKSYQIDNSFVDGLINAATIAFNTDELTKAIELYKKAIEEEPELGELYQYLLFALGRSEDFETVLEYALKWFELDETNRDAVEWVMAGAQRTGDNETLAKFSAILQELSK